MRILIIEPNSSHASFLTNNLKAACFSTDTCTTGKDGSYLARTNDFDLILCHYRLPDYTASTLCEELRTKQKDTPFIVMSDISDVVTRIECLNAGADDYVARPFHFEELLARIRAILRRPKTITQPVLCVDDLTLDAMRHTVQRGKKTVYLTRKEFELLEYLMRNQGIVLSRGQILEHVWDIHADIFSNTIETHILNVRRKIDFIRQRRLIQTVPGRGYKIDVPVRV